MKKYILSLLSLLVFMGCEPNVDSDGYLESQIPDADFSADEPLIFTVGGVSFTMIPVEGGTFTMGATSEQEHYADSDEYPAHQVTLSNFYMGEIEVTQALWLAVMGSNPSYHYDDPQLPVDGVSWYDCQEFIAKLDSLTGENFRLPTEAEWEYAARGGNKSQGCRYAGSYTASDVAWHEGNTSKSHLAKEKAANELGIYDMSGNMYEWCSDIYSSTYYSSCPTTNPIINPTGPTTGPFRVLRGGSWNSDGWNCRVSDRGHYDPNNMSYVYGMRLALGVQ